MSEKLNGSLGARIVPMDERSAGGRLYALYSVDIGGKEKYAVYVADEQDSDFYFAEGDLRQVITLFGMICDGKLSRHHLCDIIFDHNNLQIL